jgi:hypothetical protein
VKESKQGRKAVEQPYSTRRKVEREQWEEGLKEGRKETKEAKGREGKGCESRGRSVHAQVAKGGFLDEGEVGGLVVQRDKFNKVLPV